MRHEVLAAVFQVRRTPDGADRLDVLLWRRGRAPHRDAWALPGGTLGLAEGLGASIRRQLAQKVDVREVAHLEQLMTSGAPDRHPGRRVVATSYLGLVPADADPCLPDDTRWHDADSLPSMAFDHAEIVDAGRTRLRAKLSYTNVGFALATPEFTMSQLCGYYRAALGHDVSATNLQRVLLRRGQIEPTGGALPSGSRGGRPAAVFRFRDRRLEVTDEFAVLRPPAADRTGSSAHATT
jgi:8-oxo-dGTP diphosphatase